MHGQKLENSKCMILEIIWDIAVHVMTKGKQQYTRAGPSPAHLALSNNKRRQHASLLLNGINPLSSLAPPRRLLFSTKHSLSRVYTIQQHQLLLHSSHAALNLSVNMLLRSTAAVPRRKQDAAAPALVLDVLHGAHHVGDAAQAGEAAETEGPCAGVRLVSSSTLF